MTLSHILASTLYGQKTHECVHGVRRAAIKQILNGDRTILNARSKMICDGNFSILRKTNFLNTRRVKSGDKTIEKSREKPREIGLLNITKMSRNMRASMDIYIENRGAYILPDTPKKTLKNKTSGHIAEEQEDAVSPTHLLLSNGCIVWLFLIIAAQSVEDQLACGIH